MAYSEEYNKAKYRKQREDAEKGAAKGDKKAAETASKIYGKNAEADRKKTSIMDAGTGGPQSQKTKADREKSEDYSDQAKGGGWHSNLRKVTRGMDSAGDVAGDVLKNVEGFRALGGAANLAKRAVGNSAKALGSWAKGAGRSGEAAAATKSAGTKSYKPQRQSAEQQAATKPAGNLKPRPPEAAPGGAKTATTTKRTVTGNVPKSATDSLNKTGVRAGVSQNAKGYQNYAKDLGGKPGDGVVKANPPPKPAAKPAETPVTSIPKRAKSTGNVAHDAFRNAPKENKSEMWKAMSKEDKASYPTQKNLKSNKTTPKKGDEPPAAAAAPKTPKGKGSKTPAAEAPKSDAPKQKPFAQWDDEAVRKYINDPKSPKDARGRVIPPKDPEPEAPAAAAASSGGSGRPKGGYVRQKMRDAKAAKEAAGTKTPVNTEAAAKVKANIAAKKDIKADTGGNPTDF